MSAAVARGVESSLEDLSASNDGSSSISTEDHQNDAENLDLSLVKIKEKILKNPPFIKMMNYDLFTHKYKVKSDVLDHPPDTTRKTGRIFVKNVAESVKSVESNEEKHMPVDDILRLIPENKQGKEWPIKYNNKSESKENIDKKSSTLKVSSNLFTSPRSKLHAKRQRIQEGDSPTSDKFNACSEITSNKSKTKNKLKEKAKKQNGKKIDHISEAKFALNKMNSNACKMNKSKVALESPKDTKDTSENTIISEVTPTKYKNKSEDKQEKENTEETATFKVSANLFMSPKMKSAMKTPIKDHKATPKVIDLDNEPDLQPENNRQDAFKFLMGKGRTSGSPPSAPNVKSPRKYTKTKQMKRKLDVAHERKKNKRQKMDKNDDDDEITTPDDDTSSSEPINLVQNEETVPKTLLKAENDNKPQPEADIDILTVDEAKNLNSSAEWDELFNSPIKRSQNKSNSGSKKVIIPYSKLSLKKKPEVVEVVKEDLSTESEIPKEKVDKSPETPTLRRTSRIRKPVINFDSLNAIDLDDEKPSKTRRKRMSSESSIESIASVSSTSSGKRRGRPRKSQVAKKVASVFEQAKPKPKPPQLSPASLQARENFLRSGVPDILKQKQKIESTVLQEEEYFAFPTVAHVEQRCTSFAWNLPSVNIDLITPEDDDTYIKKILKSTENLSSCNGITSEVKQNIPVSFHPVKNQAPLFSECKAISIQKPNYPVFDLFVTFADRNGLDYRYQNPVKSATSLSLKKITRGTPVVVAENLNQFTMWTKKYRPKCANDLLGNTEEVKSLKTWLEGWLAVVDGPGGEMFDGDGASQLKNTMILYGKPGCGKTATVYALCEELGVNVLEVNVSSRRTGKQLLQQMHEATQSHQVRKHNDQEMKMCLILIDDVDLVYQQDEQFTKELHTLITSSKRPIILITNDYNVPHVSRYVSQQYPLLSFSRLSAESMATYLQILCLVEGLTVERNALEMLLEWNVGDIRRTLLQLQFWLISGGDSIETLNSNPEAHRKCIQAFISHPEGQILPQPLDLGTLWWNIPKIVGFDRNITPNAKNKPRVRKELSDYARLIENISFSDTLNRSEGIIGGLEPYENDFELFDSVELNPRTDYYKTDRYLTEELQQRLLEGQCKKFMQTDDAAMSDEWSYAAPSKIRRWRAKQENCAAKFQRAVPLHIRHDKECFFKDVFPYLRQLARAEKDRQEKNPKRGNRGFNVLNTAGIFDISPHGMRTACKMLDFTDCHYA